MLHQMNQTSLVMGAEAVKDETYFRDILVKIVATRERTKKELKELGFSFPDSQSNFIFATHESCPAKELFEALKEKHIYVRYFNTPRIDNYLRITVGTDEEMDAFLAFVRAYLKNR